MQKLLTIFIAGLFLCWLAPAETFMRMNGQTIRLDDSLETVEEQFGSAENVSVIFFSAHSEWDEFRRNYPGFDVYSFRQANLVLQLHAYGGDAEICIEDRTFRLGMTRQEIARVLGKEGHPWNREEDYYVYLYEFRDFVAAYLFFNKADDTLRSCWFGYFEE